MLASVCRGGWWPHATLVQRNNFDQEIYASQVAYVDDFPFQSLQYQLGVSGQRFGMAPKGSDLDEFLDRMDTLYVPRLCWFASPRDSGC